jgi:hypothetical protein
LPLFDECRRKPVVGRLRNSSVIPLGARLTAGVCKGCSVTMRASAVRASRVRPAQGLAENSRALSDPKSPVWPRKPKRPGGRRPK